MDSDRGVELGFRGITFERDRETLNYFARVVADVLSIFLRYPHYLSSQVVLTASAALLSNWARVAKVSSQLFERPSGLVASN